MKGDGACVCERACECTSVGGGVFVNSVAEGDPGEKSYDQTSIVVGSSIKKLTDRIYFPP